MVKKNERNTVDSDLVLKDALKSRSLDVDYKKLIETLQVNLKVAKSGYLFCWAGICKF